MLTATWTPPEGVLFAEPETATGISYQISCSVVDALDPTVTVTGYSASISPEPTVPVLTIAPSASGVSVTASTLAGLFGIQFIDYREGDQILRVLSWDDLPPGADDIVEFRPSADTVRDYALTVTAMLSDGRSVAAVYGIQIFQDWTAGRDRLVSEVNARRD